MGNRRDYDTLADAVDREIDVSELLPLDVYQDELKARPRHVNGNGARTESAVEASPEEVSPPDESTFRLDWFADLDQIKPLKHLVKGLLVENSLFVVYGESNSGKTFWLLDVALSIAAGIPWRTRETTRGLVLYVAGEGAGSVKLRVAAYRKENPQVAGGIPFAIISQAVNFLSIDSVSKLIRTLQAAATQSAESPVLVILDTFARAIPGGNENDAQDVGAAVSAADRIREEVKCAVAFIHHSGKDPAKGARGSSALRAAADTEIFIEGQTGQRTVTVTKQRDLEPDAPMSFELSPVMMPSDEGPVTSCVVRQCDPEGKSVYTQVVLRGKAQRQFLAAMRARSDKETSRVWSLGELRNVAREIGLAKGSARSVVDALTNSPYMKMTAFGFQFIDPG